MLKIAVDCHIHTIFSGHAYNTHRENILEAKERGLAGIGVADHFWPVPGAAPVKAPEAFQRYGNFFSTENLPAVWYGVRLYNSVEADIMDPQGNLYGHDLVLDAAGRTLTESVFRCADYAIASVHDLSNKRHMTALEGTKMYLAAMANPKVLFLGHMGRAGVPFEPDPVLTAARDTGRLIEINDHSFDFGNPKIELACRAIAVRCGELGVPVVVNSDAHCAVSVGRVDKAMAMLEDIGFPAGLIANATLERFDGFVQGLK